MVTGRDCSFASGFLKDIGGEEVGDVCDVDSEIAALDICDLIEPGELTSSIVSYWEPVLFWI